MIIIEITPPEDETADTEVCIFQASLHPEDEPFPIEDALPYIEKVMEDLELDVNFDINDESTIVIAYDPSEISWKRWHAKVIDAIKDYVGDGHEVISRLRR